MTSHDGPADLDSDARAARLAALLLVRHQQLIANSPDNPSGEQLGDSANMAHDVTLEEEVAELEGCLRQLEDARLEIRQSEAGAVPAPNSDAAQITSSNDAEELPARHIGRFEILRELGRGGLGVVLLARDPLLDRQVAIKIPRPEAMLTPHLRQRFTREAQAASRLTHPNIVPIYDAGEVGPICLIAAAYVAGPSLAEWLKEQSRPADPMLAASLMAELAEAMHYAHSQGILHRDLKPSNVLLESRSPHETTPDDRSPFAWVPKITDFGLAKILDLKSNDTHSGAILGTPAYMSPEQARADQSLIGPGTDVYGLGAILYELLTGRPPFQGKSDTDTLAKLTTEEPLAPRKLNRQTPQDLEAIALKCLEKQPARRYASAGQLAEDLRRFLAGNPTIARPLSPAGRAMRWMGRNRRIAALLTAVMGLLLGLATVSTVAAIRIDGARAEAARLADQERAAREETSVALLAEKKSVAQALAAEQAAKSSQHRAEIEAATSARVAGFLVELFSTADPFRSAKLGFREAGEVGKDITLRDLLDRASRQALDSLPDEPAVRATLLDTLGTVTSNLGLIEQAAPLLSEAYEIRQQHPENEAELAASLLNMGVLRRLQGRYAEALPLLRTAAEIRTRLSGSESVEVADVEIALSWLLSEAYRCGVQLQPQPLAEAESLIKHAMPIQRARLGEFHPDLLVSGIMLVMANRGNMAELQASLMEFAKILGRQKGGEKIANAMLNYALGAAAQRQRNFEGALKYYQSCLKTSRALVGRKHLLSAVVLGSEAGALRQMGRFVEAEQAIREMFDDLFTIYPLGHPMMVESLGMLVAAVERRGDYAEAEELQKKIITIREHFSDSPLEVANARMGLVSIRVSQGRFDEAEKMYEEYLVATAGMPEQTPRFLFAGPLQMERRDYAGAEISYRQSLVYYRERKWDAAAAGTERPLAEAIFAQRPDDPEAAQLMSKSVSPDTVDFSPEYTADEIALWAKILIHQGRWQEAERKLRAVDAFLHEHTTTGSWFIGETDSVLGSLLAAKGENEEAERYLLAGFEQLRKSRGDHHRRTHDALARVVAFYRSRGDSESVERYEHLLLQASPLPAPE